jgi:hypothetical protein
MSRRGMAGGTVSVALAMGMTVAIAHAQSGTARLPDGKPDLSDVGPRGGRDPAVDG